jgi:hypothetical protein
VEVEERANWDRHRDSKTGCRRRGETPAVSRTAGQIWTEQNRRLKQAARRS